MGLDQVCFTIPNVGNAADVHHGTLPQINVVQAVKDKFPDPDDAGMQVVCRWRKHADLQAWMTRLYNQRGGKGNFNINQDVRIEELDLDDLESDMKFGLEKGHGFFWGETISSDTESTIKFISTARELLKKGDVSLYYSSWY